MAFFNFKRSVGVFDSSSDFKDSRLYFIYLGYVCILFEDETTLCKIVTDLNLWLNGVEWYRLGINWFKTFCTKESG